MSLLYTDLDFELDLSNTDWWKKVFSIKEYVHAQMRKAEYASRNVVIVIHGRRWDDLYMVMTSGDVNDLYDTYMISLHDSLFIDGRYDMVVRKRIGVQIPEVSPDD